MELYISHNYENANKSTDQFCVYGDIINPLFLAHQVAALLAIVNIHSSIRRFGPDEKLPEKIMVGTKRMVVLTESGLLRLVFASKTPKGKITKTWILGKMRLMRQSFVIAANDQKINLCVKLEDQSRCTEISRINYESARSQIRDLVVQNNNLMCIVEQNVTDTLTSSIQRSPIIQNSLHVQDNGKLSEKNAIFDYLTGRLQQENECGCHDFVIIGKHMLRDIKSQCMMTCLTLKTLSAEFREHFTHDSSIGRTSGIELTINGRYCPSGFYTVSSGPLFTFLEKLSKQLFFSP